MNPFDEHKKIYLAVCFTVAVIYAFAFGESFPFSSGIVDRIIFIFSDGIIYGGLLCLTGIMLWNIFRFAIPASYSPKYRLIFVSALAILTGLIITAAESFVIYLCFPSLFDAFVPSIHIRLFVAFLFFIIIRLFYLFYIEKKRFAEELPGKNPFQEDTVQDNATFDIRIPENATIDNIAPESAIPGNTLRENMTSESSPSEKAIIKQPNVIKAPIDRITVRSGQKINIIPIDEIIFIKADGDYISINTTKGYWLKEQTMKYTEEMLPANRFLRIHRSYIININHISRIERYGEKHQIVLHNNEKIKVSAARYQVLKQALGL